RRDRNVLDVLVGVIRVAEDRLRDLATVRDVEAVPLPGRRILDAEWRIVLLRPDTDLALRLKAVLVRREIEMRPRRCRRRCGGGRRRCRRTAGARRGDEHEDETERERARENPHVFLPASCPASA